MKYIDTPEQKRIALDILVEFAKFCEAHSLKYYLTYGTLIGAVRHKGYIPWDDDIDVWMPRKDYETFIHSFQGHPYYEVMANEINPNYGKLFAVLNDTRTVKTEKLTRKRCEGTVCVNIDIFPVDYLPDNADEQIELLRKVKSIENKLACLTYAYGRGRTFLSTIRKNIGIFIYRTLDTFNIITTRKLARQHRRLLSQYSDTNTAGCFANTGFNGMEEVMPLKCFQDQIEMEFEGHILKVPKEYDYILRHIYGDYMQLPPESERVSIHSNICYWKDTYDSDESVCLLH